MENLKPTQEDYEAVCRNQGLFEYLNQKDPEVVDRLSLDGRAAGYQSALPSRVSERFGDLGGRLGGKVDLSGMAVASNLRGATRSDAGGLLRGSVLVKGFGSRIL